MSKLKSKKYKAKVRNPVGIPTLREAEIFFEPSFPSNISSIAEKLSSSLAEEKETGAVILSNLSENQKFVSNLIENKLLRLAAPLLLDKNLNVRHAIAGSLRNIAVCGDYLVSEAMIEQDVLTPLVTLLEEYKQPWTLAKVKEDKKLNENVKSMEVSKSTEDRKPIEDIIDSKAEIFLEACNLLWTLCENSSTAVSIFNRKNLISILLPCLSIEIYGLKIPIAVAQCLHTVSENNSAVIDILHEPLVQEQLRALMNLPYTTPESFLLKALAAAIVANMYGNKIEECMIDVTRPILQVVSSTLHEPISPMLKDLLNKIICQKAGYLDKYHEEEDIEKERVAVRKAEESLSYILSAKQTSLEILGNVFEGGSDDECDTVSCSDNSDEVEMEVEEYDVSVAEIGQRISKDIHDIVVNDRILEKVQEQIFLQCDEAEKNVQDDELTKDCLKRLGTVRCTALLCLNNMLPKLEIEDVGGPSKLLELWLNIAKVLFKKTDLSNTDQVEAATRCMYAVLQKLALAGFTSQFSNMTDVDLELLINVHSMSKEPRIKVHIIGCLGTIGKILCQVKVPSSAVLIRMIGSFLIESCNKSADLWVLAETFDAIIDVFSDDDVDFIAKEIDLVEKLSRLRILFDKKVKQQRRFLGDRADVIRTAKENLRNFIKYKLEFNKK